MHIHRVESPPKKINLAVGSGPDGIILSNLKRHGYLANKKEIVAAR